MKWIIAVTLSVLLVGNSFYCSVIYSWYLLDLDSFVEQLCENVDRPQLQCNGKCQMSKIVDNGPVKDSQSTPALEWEQFFYCLFYATTPVITAAFYIRKEMTYYNRLYNSMVISPLEHPPCSL
jgi:hypothetical protein